MWYVCRQFYHIFFKNCIVSFWNVAEEKTQFSTRLWLFQGTRTSLEIRRQNSGLWMMIGRRYVARENPWCYICFCNSSEENQRFMEKRGYLQWITWAVWLLLVLVKFEVCCDNGNSFGVQQFLLWKLSWSFPYFYWIN